MTRATVMELQKQLEEKQKIIDMQQGQIDTLKSRIEDLEIVEMKKHNERGAGRKSKLTKEQINKVSELHSEGLSYGAIAKEVEISKAYVYKLINEPVNMGNDKQPMTEEAYNRYREHSNILRKELRDLGRTHKGTEDLPPYEEYIKNFK